MFKAMAYGIAINAFALINCSVSTAGEVLKFTTGEWPPFFSDSLKHQGILPHIVTESMAYHDISVQYEFFPWSRALYLGKQKQWDGTLAWVESEERRRDYYFSNPIYQIEMALYSRDADDFDWQSYDDLQGLRIGIMRGSYARHQLERLQEQNLNITYETATLDIQNFRKLEAGRLDLVVANKRVGNAILLKNYTKQEAKKFIPHPVPFYTRTLHVLFNKQQPRSKEYLNKLNDGYSRLKRSNKLDLLWQSFED